VSLADYPPHIRLFASLLAQEQTIRDVTALRASAFVITAEQEANINLAVPGGFTVGPGCEAYGLPVIRGEKPGLFYEVEVP
jgi:hypothetical protein